jgi:hypothetical protein
MKKWSISLLVLAALAITAFVVPATSSATGSSPYCPSGQTGTPPYCVTPPPTNPPTNPPPPSVCAAGQVGTFPNCVTPAVSVGTIKINPKTTTVVLSVNAAGKVKVSGKGIKQKSIGVSPGNVKIKVQLTSKEKKLLKKKGKVKVSVTVTYSPTGGTPITKTIKLVIKSKAKS